MAWSRRRVRSRSSSPTMTAAARLSTSQAAASSWPDVRRYSPSETSIFCAATYAAFHATCRCFAAREAGSKTRPSSNRPPGSLPSGSPLPGDHLPGGLPLGNRPSDSRQPKLHLPLTCSMGPESPTILASCLQLAVLPTSASAALWEAVSRMWVHGHGWRPSTSTAVASAAPPVVAPWLLIATL